MSPIQKLNTKVIDAGDMSGNITSSSLDVREVIRLCIQASWSGTAPVGTLHVQGSNDNINFNDDPEISPSAISGNTGSALVKINNCSYPYLRLSYTFTSGVGSLTGIVSGKTP